jgi:hypothetical protein
MESEQVDKVEAAPVAAVAVEETVDFDEWYALRKNAIPVHHRKEILLADFKARKMPMTAKIREFDATLNKYGVKLS